MFSKFFERLTGKAAEQASSSVDAFNQSEVASPVRLPVLNLLELLPKVSQGAYSHDNDHSFSPMSIRVSTA